ncbi:hypothetical protein ELY38_01055 [Vreelandella nanhaiensis]|uniref:Putative mRNA interferase YoeB n=1 Tax=Vreelandella nanhaiensis TaxID=1258546 RepID=A0A433KY61_9GAMM|nr:hypothetical protein ELY38_01055 [Halomonas nanhaiensis]
MQRSVGGGGGRCKRAHEPWNDYLHWQTQGKKTLKRINRLINDAKRLPLEGIGKPEPLKETWLA